MIQIQLVKIGDLASEGRSAKRRNRIDSKWDDGVGSYIQVNHDLNLLTGQLSTHIHEFQSMKDGRQGKAWTIVGTVLGVLFAILSILLVLYPSMTTAIQRFIGVVP